MTISIHLKDGVVLSASGDALDVVHGADVRMIIVQNSGSPLYWISADNFEYAQIA